MIGGRFKATLWQVRFSYQLADKPQIGECFVATADPSGADVLEVLRTTVMPDAGATCEQLALVHVQRLCELRGLGIIEPSRAPFDDAGAAILVATEHHRAEIGRLRLELSQSSARVAELERQKALHGDSLMLALGMAGTAGGSAR